MDTFVVSVCPLDPDSSDFGDVCALYAPFLHQLTMQSSLFERGCPVLVVACVARKLRPCPSYNRRRDRINLGLWRSLYKGGGGYEYLGPAQWQECWFALLQAIVVEKVTYILADEYEERQSQTSSKRPKTQKDSDAEGFAGHPSLLPRSGPTSDQDTR